MGTGTGTWQRTHRIVLRLGLLGSLIWLAACVSASSAKTADAYRELGLSYFHEGNLESALRELIKARDMNPRDARIRHELGLAFFAKGLHEKAEPELRRAVRLDPGLTEARLNLASLYIALERYEEAEKHLKLVLEDYLYRSPARAWSNLGWIYFKQGRYPEALTAYDQMLRIAPRFCQGLYNVALLHRERADLEKGLIFAQQGVDACAEDLRLRLLLGELLLGLGRTDEAAAQLEVVIARDTAGGLAQEARALLAEPR